MDTVDMLNNELARPILTHIIETEFDRGVVNEVAADELVDDTLNTADDTDISDVMEDIVKKDNAIVTLLRTDVVEDASTKLACMEDPKSADSDDGTVSELDAQPGEAIDEGTDEKNNDDFTASILRHTVDIECRKENTDEMLGLNKDVKKPDEDSKEDCREETTMDDDSATLLVFINEPEFAVELVDRPQTLMVSVSDNNDRELEEADDTENKPVVADDLLRVAMLEDRTPDEDAIELPDTLAR